MSKMLGPVGTTNNISQMGNLLLTSTNMETIKVWPFLAPFLGKGGGLNPPDMRRLFSQANSYHVVIHCYKHSGCWEKTRKKLKHFLVLTHVFITENRGMGNVFCCSDTESSSIKMVNYLTLIYQHIIGLCLKATAA